VPQLVEAFCFHQQRKRIDVKVTLETVSEKTEPAVLSDIGKLLTLLRALVFEPEHILKMMNHLMNEHGYLGRRAAGPPLGQIDGSGGVVIDGYGIVSSRRGSIVRCNLRSLIG
jgi:hypothetical protein